MEEKRSEIFAGNTRVFSVLSLHYGVSCFQNHLIAKNSISYMHCMPLYMVQSIHDLIFLESREEDNHVSYFFWPCGAVPAFPGVPFIMSEGLLKSKRLNGHVWPLGKRTQGAIVTFIADLGCVKFFIPRISFGTHDRHLGLSLTSDSHLHGTTQSYSGPGPCLESKSLTWDP